MSLLVLFGLTLTALQIVTSARILGVFPIPSISHQVVYRALTTELARRGHQLTVVTPDPIWDHGIPQQNYVQIDIHNISYTLFNNMFDFAKFRDDTDNPLHLYPIGKKTCLQIFEAQIESPQMQSLLLNSTEEFDLLLIESFNAYFFSFAWRFKAPYIGILSMTATLSNFESLGNPTHPLLYPDFFRQKAVLTNIWERMETLYYYLYIRFMDYWFHPQEMALARKHFGEDCPDPLELEQNMDMLFMNYNPILSGIRPTVPSIVTLGGMHLKPKNKLPKDLQDILDESKEGVIYMSLGSNVKSKSLSPATLKTIVEVFAELPYKVLWKFEDDFDNPPKNLKTSRWFPQQDLLGHQNVKVFITQGGQQSLEEAIRDEVPLIGIPFIGDQDLNVQNIVRLGIGAGLDIKTLTKEQFNATILNVINDPRYKTAIKRVKSQMFDQPMTSVERAVWWTEYVLRHGGAAHLRAPAAGVSIAEYIMLDIVGVLLLGVALVLLTSVVIYKQLCKLYLYEYLKLKND